MRYNYTYFINNKEVDKKTFEQKLMQHYLVCDTHYDNPLLNVSYVDYKKYEREYHKLKTNDRYRGIMFFVNETVCESFRIRREAK